MTATDMDGADDGTVGESWSEVEPSCWVEGCGRTVVDAGLCLPDLVRAALTG